MAIRQTARSVISGSRAMFSRTVSPLASVAASNRFSVAPTDCCGKDDVSTGQAARGLGVDEAALDFDLGAELRQPLQVQVDRAAADGAAAGQRHERLAAAREQRPEHEHACAHLAHELIGRGRVRDLAGRQ